MNDIIKNIEAEQLKENAPEFHVGDTVKVYGKIKEGNRERIQVFEGTVLKKQGGGAQRAHLQLERIPTESALRKHGRCILQTLRRLKLYVRGKVRRAKLNYLRDRVGKRAKVKELVK